MSSIPGGQEGLKDDGMELARGPHMPACSWTHVLCTRQSQSLHTALRVRCTDPVLASQLRENTHPAQRSACRGAQGVNEEAVSLSYGAGQ